MAGSMVRWQCEARGLVQRVGYRDRVRRTAKELGLTGWVENDAADEDRVVFEAQGPQAMVERLLRAVEGPGGLSDAKEVRRLGEPAVVEGDRGFAIRRGGDVQEAMAERMDEAALYLGASLEVGRETLSVSKETLAVSKETLGVSKETLAVSKETLGEVRTGNRKLLKKMEEGIAGTRRLHREVTRRFDRTDAAFGRVGTMLGRIDGDLKGLTRALLKVAVGSARSRRAVTARGRSRVVSRKR